MFSFSLALGAQIPVDQLNIEAQTFGEENTHLVINNNLFLAGERLHYRAFCLSGSGDASSLSEVMYVSLRTDEDSIVFDHKIRLNEGAAHGFFFIPTTIQTGVYRILSFTNFALNNTDHPVSQDEIYIINPFVKPAKASGEKLDRKVISLAPETSNPVDQATKRDISLTTDKSSYALREKISLTMVNTVGALASGNYAVSIRKLAPLQLPEVGSHRVKYEYSEKNIFHLPELRGELLSGRVVTAELEQPVPNKEVAFSLPGSDYIFKLAKTNKDGRFFISIDESYGNGDAIVQVVGEDREQFKVIIESGRLNALSRRTASVLELDPEIKNWLEERSVQVQIQNAYFNEENIVLTGEAPVERFYKDIGRGYELDEYTRFPTMRETFIEVIKVARIRKREGKDVFEVFDPDHPYKIGPFSNLDPLLLVDGVFMQDASDVIAISAQEVKHIHVYPAPYRYGPIIFRGIIDIETKEGNVVSLVGSEQLNSIRMAGPQTRRNYATPDYASASQDRIPDYRVQLLWEPNVRIDTQEVLQHFYASDLPGTYQIVLQGYTEQGRYLQVKSYFEVVE